MPGRRWAAVTMVAASAIAGCSEPTDQSPPSPPSFQAPTLVPSPVSTDGWEDSGLIAPDGATLYFTYLRLDPITFLNDGIIRLHGPVRPGWPTIHPFDSLGAEIYRSRLVGGQWSEPENLGPVINLPEGLEGDQWVSEDGNRILFSNGSPSQSRPIQSLYYAERSGGVWSTPVLASSIGFPFVEFDENPHLTRDEQTLFFESSRPGGSGLQDIWMSRRTGSGWSPAENLGPGINTAGVDGSPFSLDGTELFWDDKGGGRGISWAARRSDGTWTAPVVVLPGSFGDPSVTLAGDLYVVGGRVTADGFDADLYLARRR